MKKIQGSITGIQGSMKNYIIKTKFNIYLDKKKIEHTLRIQSDTKQHIITHY